VSANFRPIDRTPQPFEPLSRAHAMAHILERETGLHRSLNARKMSMIAIGGAIGTGLFLGIGFAIAIAGPAVLLSYTVGAVLALLLMGCLAEMTTAHPTSGSFGTYAEHYVGPLAGFLVRYVYWVGNVLAIGTEVAAISIYMKYWFPSSPGWFWSAGFSLVLIYANSSRVGVFGTIEYWLCAAKLTFIVIFLLLAGRFVFESALTASNGHLGLNNYLAYGGFFPKGAAGVWIAVILAVFSYMGIEMIAVAAGEAEQPEEAVRRAFKSTVTRLIVFYLGTLAVILAVLPWTAAKVDASPFVQVMETLRLPRGADFVNFAVLIAALSAINSQLYIATRMMFSLSRASHAPRAFGRMSRHGVPVNALLASSGGIALATVLSVTTPQSAYVSIVALSVFSAAFTWMMIFVTHYFFRRARMTEGGHAPLRFRIPGFPVTTVIGAAMMAAILITTLATPEFRLTLIFGVPFVCLLTLLYYVHYRPRELRRRDR
jgi:L-asparagine transporter-like permease